jgi:hypothetical protein
MWLYVPSPAPAASMSSASAPEAEDLTSASNWQSQALALSCWWRGKPSPSPIWLRRCDKVSWLKRLSGAMCETSPGAHGVALWMALLAESRVSPTLSPEDGSAPRTNEIYGVMPAGSSSRRGRGSSSSKMSAACSRAAAPSASSETFADLVIRLRSDYSARQRSARATNGNEFSSSQWPTARVWDSEAGSDPAQRFREGAGGPTLTTLATRLWPAVSATEARQGFQRRPEGMASEQNQQSLTTIAMLWPTPIAANHRSIYASDETHAKTEHARPLNEFVGRWTTPTASENKRGDRPDWQPHQKTNEHSLNRQASQWPTPVVTVSNSARNQTSGRSNPDSKHHNGVTLTDAIFLYSLPDRPISTVGEESSHICRTLNPLFVEWLMGWPPGWTLLALTPPASSAFASSERALFHFKQHMRSALFALGLPQAAPPVQLSLYG